MTIPQLSLKMLAKTRLLSVLKQAMGILVKPELFAKSEKKVLQ